MIVCSACGNQNQDGAMFCDECGAKLSAPASAGFAPASGGATAGGEPVCPSCGTPFTLGQAFCDECGASLSGVGAVSAPPVSSPPPLVPTPQPAPAPSAAPAPAPSGPYVPVGVRLTVAADGHLFSLNGKTTYLIGREDPISGVFPDVDLASHGGEEGGVSRRHAHLHIVGSQVMIEDLNSTNYTYVNKQRVQPGVKQPVDPGDELRLGKVVLRLG